MTGDQEVRIPRPSVGQFVVIFVVAVVGLVLIAWILPGFSVDGWGSGALAVLVVTVINTVVWPFVVRFGTRLLVWTLGLFGLVVNGLSLLLTAELVDGFEVEGLGTAVLATLGMTAVGAVTGSLLAIDDDAVWRRNVVRRMVRRVEQARDDGRSGNPVPADRRPLRAGVPQSDG